MLEEGIDSDKNVDLCFSEKIEKQFQISKLEENFTNQHHKVFQVILEGFNELDLTEKRNEEIQKQNLIAKKETK